MRQKKYFLDSDEKIFIDLRRGKGDIGESQRVNRGDSDLRITVELKAPTTTKNGTACDRLLSR